MLKRREIIRTLAVAAGLAVAMLGVGPGTVPTATAQDSSEDEETETAADSKVNPGDVSGADDEESSSSPKEGTSEEEASGEESKKSSKKASADEGGDGEAKSGSADSRRLPAPEDAGEEFQAELQEFRRAYKRYSTEIKDYQKTVDSIVDAEYQKRKSEITKQYDRRADQLKVVERQRRSEAIARFKKFLDRHPNRPVYTPDAMYRLAELYFEKANDEYLQADERYQEEMKRYQAGRRPSPPKSPKKDYSQTIETFSKLIEEWPDYRLLDGAYYLLAYCHEQMGHPRKARDLFAELIVKRPQSEFVPEAWLRIGEYHFDRSDDPKEIALARNAYRQSMKYEESTYFDKALYKLAWSNYRLDDFDKAIKNFERLVEWRDETGDKSGSVLRREAIKYMAISLAEEDWDLDRKVDDGFVMPRIKKYLGEGKPYERKVLKQLVSFLMERTRNERAAKVVRYTLKKYPNHPDNPKLHKELIKALMRPPQKVDEAFEERRRLIDLYGPDSDWYAYQKKQGNEEAVAYGQRLIGDNLIQAATWYHEQAQKLKDEAKVKQDQALAAKARKRYAKAAQAYKKFLKRYPNDKDIYRWNFYYADSLYYAGKYEQAYQQYRVVRELDIRDNKFQADAGFNAIKSLEFQIKKLVDQGKLPESVVPSKGRKEARKAAKRQKKQGKSGSGEGEGRSAQKKPSIEKKPVPGMVKKYITAMDRYVILRLDYKEQTDLAPKFAFNAAKIFYDYKHYDTARERFAWIVDNYPEREEAYLAGSLILETYRQEKKYDKLATWAEKLSGVLKGKQAEQVKKEVREFKLGALFKSAEKLFDQEKYDKAAEEYIRLVNKAPDHENAPRALNNAAVAYEEIKKYQSALKLYRRVYREYPESALAGYALYRVAVNSERFFEYDDAIRTYKLFYEKYRGKETPEDLAKMDFRLEDKRPKALLSAAVLAENLQRYEEAAERYESFVERYPNNDEAESAQWQAVESWKKAGDTQAMFDAFETYRREFGSDPENADRVLEGMMRRAEYYEKQGREEEALDQYREIIDTFKKRGLEPGTDPAYYAAKAQFQLAEREFDDWQKIKIEGDLDRQKNLLKKKVEEQKGVANAFKKVWTYKNLEYTLASGFRIGSLFQKFAESLYNVPIPYEPGTKKYMIYRRELDKQARPLENKAISRWKKTIKKARESKIVNKWTKKTLKALNQYRPQEFPLYKESRTARQQRTVTGRSMLRNVPEKPKSDDSEGDETGGDESGSGPSSGGSSSKKSGGESGSESSS